MFEARKVLDEIWGLIFLSIFYFWKNLGRFLNLMTSIVTELCFSNWIWLIMTSVLKKSSLRPEMTQFIFARVFFWSTKQPGEQNHFSVYGSSLTTEHWFHTKWIFEMCSRFTNTAIQICSLWCLSWKKLLWKFNYIHVIV